MFKARLPLKVIGILHVSKNVLVPPVMQGCIKLTSSPRERRAGRGLRRGVNKNAHPLLHSMVGREKN
jgi:hypothetical protein